MLCTSLFMLFLLCSLKMFRNHHFNVESENSTTYSKQWLNKLAFKKWNWNLYFVYIYTYRHYAKTPLFFVCKKILKYTSILYIIQRTSSLYNYTLWYNLWAKYKIAFFIYANNTSVNRGCEPVVIWTLATIAPRVGL